MDCRKARVHFRGGGSRFFSALISILSETQNNITVGYIDYSQSAKMALWSGTLNEKLSKDHPTLYFREYRTILRIMKKIISKLQQGELTRRVIYRYMIRERPELIRSFLTDEGSESESVHNI